MRVEAPEWMCLKVSQRAVQLANETMRGYGWSNEALSALQPMPGTGRAGMRTTAKYLIHQDRGIRPFVMTWVEGRVIPLSCPQPLYADILTPWGWKQMGELSVGDQVVDPLGEEFSYVEGIYPQGDLEVFRVTLADGSKTHAAGDHLWTLDDGIISTTVELKQRIDNLLSKPARYRHTGSRPSPQWFPRVPALHPVIYQPGESLPISPYTLGALLGDGDMSDRKLLFHSVDKENICRIEEELPRDLEIVHISGARHHIRLVDKHKTGPIASHPYLIALRELGLHGHTCYTKFIPERYKRASLEDRIELLRGLFDTDGSCSTASSVDFYTTSERLARDVREVINSIGGRCSTQERRSTNFSSRQKDLGRFNGRKSYVLGVNSPINLFSLTRKSERFRIKDDRRMRRIVDVTPVGKEICQCIRVSALSQLYVTDDFIPTHNSQGDGPHIRRGKDPGQPGWVNIPHVGRVWREQKWRHPGLPARNFMENALSQAVQEIKPLAKQMLVQSLAGRDKTRTI